NLLRIAYSVNKSTEYAIRNTNQETLMSYNLGIIILSVSDLQQAREFYSHKLGLPEVPELTDDHFIAVATANGGLLGLRLAGFGPSAKPGAVEIGLEVDDVDATWRDWQAKGLTDITAPADTPFGRACDAHDPDGHPLSIYHLEKR